MEFDLFVVHLFCNITLYKANYNTNTFWPRGISKRQLEHSFYYDYVHSKKYSVKKIIFIDRCLTCNMIMYNILCFYYTSHLNVCTTSRSIYACTCTSTRALWKVFSLTAFFSSRVDEILLILFPPIDCGVWWGEVWGVGDWAPRETSGHEGAPPLPR